MIARLTKKIWSAMQYFTGLLRASGSITIKSINKHRSTEVMLYALLVTHKQCVFKLCLDVGISLRK